MRYAACPEYAKSREGNTTNVKANCMAGTEKWDRSAKRASVPVIQSIMPPSEVQPPFFSLLKYRYI
uniref:Uncharacterized protein n=1 Tax=Rhizophora mucronata TaxID=61149 RepID=A0A2P2QV10_RHIMU